MEKKTQQAKQNKTQQQGTNLVWDCGSTLYDSFELNSFNRQLDSAIASRTLSMPHLPDRRAPPPLPSPPVSKKSSKISRSLHKFLKIVFKSKQVQQRSHDQYYAVYDMSGALTTIPEVPEIDFGALSPEMNSLVTRTASERFAATSIGVSCA